MLAKSSESFSELYFWFFLLLCWFGGHGKEVTVRVSVVNNDAVYSLLTTYVFIQMASIFLMLVLQIYF